VLPEPIDQLGKCNGRLARPREPTYRILSNPPAPKRQRELSLFQRCYRSGLFNNRLSTRKSMAPASGDYGRSERSFFLRHWGLCDGLADADGNELGNCDF
jgi:hypothetical protein